MIKVNVRHKPLVVDQVDVVDTVNKNILVIMPSTVKPKTVTIYLSGFDNSKLQLTPDEARAVAKEIENLAQQVEGDFMYE